MLKTEQSEHINIVTWFHLQFPELADDFHHFANERKCSIAHGHLLKKMGVKRGVSDFFVGIPSGGYHGLWIELKVGKGKLSPEQIAFINRKNERGYLAIAVWGFDAAIEIIKTYLGSTGTKCIINTPKNCI